MFSLNRPSLRECENLSIKSRIGKTAVDIIENGDAVILDSGTTTYQIAKNLKCKDFAELTVITNSIPIAYELMNSPHIHLIVLGESAGLLQERWLEALQRISLVRFMQIRSFWALMASVWNGD